MASEEARRAPEVVAIARRRKFFGSEKRRLPAEAERCRAAGTLGAFLFHFFVHTRWKYAYCSWPLYG
jgi:hypothetical protein